MTLRIRPARPPGTSLASALIIDLLAFLLNSWLFMIVAGIFHGSDPHVPAIGYGMSLVAVLFAVQCAHTTGQIISAARKAQQ